MFLREYNSNKLLREDPISAEELDAVFGPFERRRERRQKRRIRTKRVSDAITCCSCPDAVGLICTCLTFARMQPATGACVMFSVLTSSSLLLAPRLMTSVGAVDMVICSHAYYRVLIILLTSVNCDPCISMPQL